MWKVQGRRIYDMSLAETGSLFASRMESQNFPKIILKKSGGELWLEMGVEYALFIYLSEYITFMTRSRVQQSQKCEKLRKKQIEAEIVNFSRVQRRSQVSNMRNVRVTTKYNAGSRALQPPTDSVLIPRKLQETTKFTHVRAGIMRSF